MHAWLLHLKVFYNSCSSPIVLAFAFSSHRSHLSTYLAFTAACHPLSLPSASPSLPHLPFTDYVGRTPERIINLGRKAPITTANPQLRQYPPPPPLVTAICGGWPAVSSETVYHMHVSRLVLSRHFLQLQLSSALALEKKLSYHLTSLYQQRGVSYGERTNESSNQATKS